MGNNQRFEIEDHHCLKKEKKKKGEEEVIGRRHLY